MIKIHNNNLCTIIQVIDFCFSWKFWFFKSNSCFEHTYNYKNAKKVKTLGGLQNLCFIGNKNRPRGLWPGGGMLNRRDYVGSRTAAELLSSSSLQRYKENLITPDTILLNFWQSYVLFCSNTDTFLLKWRLTDTILLFFGPSLPSISSTHDPGDHTWRPNYAGTWQRLQPKSILLFPYNYNADHPNLLQADPKERGSKQHNERR